MQQRRQLGTLRADISTHQDPLGVRKACALCSCSHSGKFLHPVCRRCTMVQCKGWHTAEVARTLTERSAGGMMGLCSQNTIGIAVGSAE